MEIKSNWLREDCSDWPKYKSGRKLKGFIQGFRVTNNTAEHGVKLIQYFVSSCQDEDLRQNLVLRAMKSPYYVTNVDLKKM